MTLYDKEQASIDVQNIVFRHCKIGKVTRKQTVLRKLQDEFQDEFNEYRYYLTAWPSMKKVFSRPICGTASPPIVPAHGVML